MSLLHEAQVIFRDEKRLMASQREKELIGILDGILHEISTHCEKCRMISSVSGLGSGTDFKNQSTAQAMLMNEDVETGKFVISIRISFDPNINELTADTYNFVHSDKHFELIEPTSIARIMEECHNTIEMWHADKT